MTNDEETKKTSMRRRIGKVGLVLGLLFIVIVIVLGLLTSWVSAQNGSIELLHAYEIIAVPSIIIGIILLLGGLVAILLPEGLSKDGLWSMQTGPYLR
ncbi:MAG: hypothetical protein ACFFDQ_12150 [Candidatus Thorarchaeota archaeon]